MNRQRLFFPDLLRVVAAFLVVLIHVTSIGIQDAPVSSKLWCVSMVLNSISRWSVPVFFMISGMFLLNPEYNVPLKKLYRKNISRIALCIVVWGFFYSLLDQYQYGGLSLKSPFVAVYGILTDNTGYHLWFLYTLLALYIATPTLRVFTANASEGQVRYAVAVWFVFCVCFGAVNRMASAFLDIDGFLPDGAVVIVGSAGYYLLGYYLHRYPIPGKLVPVLYVLSAACFCAIPVLNVCFPRAGIQVGFSEWMGIGSFAIASGVFVFASRLREEVLPERFCNTVRWFSDRSFGIYLIHVFYVSLIFRILNSGILNIVPELSVLGGTIVIFLLSSMTSSVFNRIKGLKQLV